MKPTEQYNKPSLVNLSKLRLLLAAALLLTYTLFSRTAPVYGHLTVGAGFLLLITTLVMGLQKKTRPLILLSAVGEAVFIQAIAVITGFYASPFLFLFLLPPYLSALTNGPRWAWYSGLLYFPYLVIALADAVRHQDWRWAVYTAVIWILLLVEADTIFKLERTNKDLISRAHRDPLTNLANRHALEEICAGIDSGSVREVCTVAMLDLDNFKRHNDLFGHLEGDRLLQKVAEALQESMRGDDLVLRYGGDEFLVILWGASRDEAQKVIKRIRARIWEKARCRITTGSATSLVRKRSEFMDLLNQADHELFTKKKEGKEAPAQLLN